jgi:hypothetical protein
MRTMKALPFPMLAGVLIFGLAAGLCAEETEKSAPVAPTVRGTLTFGGTGLNSMTHWDEYSWEFEAIRWGRYHVDLHYHGLRRAMGVQARLRSGEERAKGFLKPGGTADDPMTVRLGTIYVPAHGVHELVLLTPQDDPLYDFKLSGLQLVPAPEGEEVTQDPEGNVTLLAKDATTFSEKMRYEPKEEKNCLGFWVLIEDRAQWEFEVTEPGSFAVTVFQGCGKGNGGSEVAVELGGQRNTFVVKDTGGFQNWEGVAAGELKIASTGRHTLSIVPVTQAGKAVMDVQKVVLGKKG